MWGYRLGVRQPFGRQAAHGLHQMTHNEETLTNHPEWFALYGGKRQDAVAMFDEYCRLFYGPAAGPMREFFHFCEDNWREMESDVAKTNRALELFAAAQAAAGDDSIYAQRIAFVDNYLNGLRNKSVQLAQKRGADPTVTDYLIAGQSAADLLRQRKFQDAMDAYVALASRIPIDAVAKTVRMENLLAQRKFDEVVEQFGDALKEAGHNDEALAAYREVLEEPAASSSDRQAAEAAVKAAGTSWELSNPTPNP